MFGSSARTSSGRAGPGEGPEKVFKSGNYSYSQRSKQASQGLAPHGSTATISTSTKVAAAHVQGRLEPQPEASSLAAESYARTCSVASHRGRTPICGLLHRKDFEVERICKKLLADTKVIYEVRWKSSWVPAKLIVEGNDDEYSHVDADGIRWYIEESFSYREKNGIEEVKVGWMDTKEPVEMLSNAQQAIDIFEADLRLTGADEIAQVRQRTVLTIPESQFPRDSVLSQSEEDYDEAQRWVSSTWPEIRPHERLDLYPAIYRIHMEIASPRRQKKRGGKSYRCLMKLPQLRPLRWNDDFLRSGATLTCCRRKRASLFIQVTGTQVVRHCSRCSHGRLTPFLECVQTALDQQLWLNGACANCGTQGNICCDYHGVFIGRTGNPSNSRYTHHESICWLDTESAFRCAFRRPVTPHQRRIPTREHRLSIIESRRRREQ